MPNGVQRGLPGVAPEEAALPSEAVLNGELLADRRREALVALRAALGASPEGFEPAEWRVVVAALAPAPASGGVGTASARAELVARASACFPGHAPPAAARLFREVLARPHVAAVVADFRALEMLDVQAQRGWVRESLSAIRDLWAVITPALAVADPSGTARLASAIVQANKALMDLDGLRARADDDQDGAGASGGQDPGAALAEKLGRVLGDLQARSMG